MQVFFGALVFDWPRQLYFFWLPVVDWPSRGQFARNDPPLDQSKPADWGRRAVLHVAGSVIEEPTPEMPFDVLFFSVFASASRSF